MQAITPKVPPNVFSNTSLNSAIPKPVIYCVVSMRIENMNADAKIDFL